jgi:toxin ParE1/3/4
MNPLILSPEAETELTHAYEWYEVQRSGLGREFLTSIDDAFARIRRDPAAFPQTYKNVRQTLLRRFPYVICYTFDGASIDILAIFHGHRDPNEWKRRLS